MADEIFFSALKHGVGLIVGFFICGALGILAGHVFAFEAATQKLVSAVLTLGLFMLYFFVLR